MSYKSGKLFLTLDDAVKVATLHFDINPVIAKQEFEQKCFVPCTDYEMGYYDGLAKARETIMNVMEGGDDSE